MILLNLETWVFCSNLSCRREQILDFNSAHRDILLLLIVDSRLLLVIARALCSLQQLSDSLSSIPFNSNLKYLLTMLRKSSFLFDF